MFLMPVCKTGVNKELGWRREVRFLHDPLGVSKLLVPSTLWLVRLSAGHQFLKLERWVQFPYESLLKLKKRFDFMKSFAPVCCDGIGGLAFNQMSPGLAGSIPVRSALFKTMTLFSIQTCLHRIDAQLVDSTVELKWI